MHAKVDKRFQDKKDMAQVAVRYHLQLAYIGCVLCKQAEWQYVQQVVGNTVLYFETLEEAIHMPFVPALLGLTVR